MNRLSAIAAALQGFDQDALPSAMMRELVHREEDLGELVQAAAAIMAERLTEIHAGDDGALYGFRRARELRTQLSAQLDVVRTAITQLRANGW